jgi:DNA-binding MarR family transcriptional regulator
MKFFSPTSELKELLLLQHIEKNPDTTQKEIAKVISGAKSMVNVYIDNLEENGYMVRDYQSAKIVYYNITPEGVKRKNYLLINYMRELLDLYRLAKENVEKFLLEIEERGYSKLLIYGAGEVAETILGVIRDRNKDTLKVLAVIDDNDEIQGKELLGYKIISRADINHYEHDAVIITSYAYEDEIRGKLKELNYSENKIIRFFS